MIQALGAEYATLSPNQDSASLIFKVDSVKETYEKMKDTIKFFTKPHEQKDWGLKVVHLRDPAGNLIELYENIPM